MVIFAPTLTQNFVCIRICPIIIFYTSIVLFKSLRNSKRRNKVYYIINYFKIRGESSNLLRETEERMEETNHIEILEVQVIDKG